MDNDLKEEVKLLGVYLRNEEERTKKSFEVLNELISGLKKEIDNLKKEVDILKKDG